MTTIPAFQSGLNGIASGFEKLNQNSATIASASIDGSGQDITKALVGLVSNKQQIEASIKVIETSNETIGTLLDIIV